MKKPVVDLWDSLNILSDLKDDDHSEAIQHITRNLENSHDQVQYGKTALERLYEHPLFKNETLDNPKLSNTKQSLLNWFAQNYHPNIFKTPDLFGWLLQKKRFADLYSLLINSSPEEKEANIAPDYLLNYTILKMNSTDPHELAVYGYLCNSKIIYFNEYRKSDTVHRNPVVALNYFVTATTLGLDCWSEIENIITEIFPSQNFASEKTFLKIAQHLGSEVLSTNYGSSLSYNNSSMQALREEASATRLTQIFQRLTEMLGSEEHPVPFYLKALSISDDKDASVPSQIRKLNLYLKAAALGHPLGFDAFLKSWGELITKEINPLQIPIFTACIKLFTVYLINLLPGLGISALIDYCDILQTKLFSLKENTALIDSVHGFCKTVIAQPEIDHQLPVSDFRKLIGIVSSLNPELAPLNLKNLQEMIQQKIQRLILSISTIKNSSEPRDIPIDETGSLVSEDILEEKHNPAQAELNELLLLLEEPAFKEFKGEGSKNMPIALEGGPRLFNKPKNDTDVGSNNHSSSSSNSSCSSSSSSSSSSNFSASCG